MPTTRIRRARANPPEPQDEDRLYTEEDYAEPQPYIPSWTGDALLPDEAFQPDEEELPSEEWAEPAYEEAYDSYLDGPDGFDDSLDPLDAELLTEEEQAELRRSRWQLLAGLADFAGVILGTAAILVLVTLLVSLLNWLVNDLSQSFILLQKNF